MGYKVCRGHELFTQREGKSAESCSSSAPLEQAALEQSNYSPPDMPSSEMPFHRPNVFVVNLDSSGVKG